MIIVFFVVVTVISRPVYRHLPGNSLEEIGIGLILCVYS